VDGAAVGQLTAAETAEGRAAGQGVGLIRAESNHEDLWLDCLSERDVAERVGVEQKTINNWVSKKRTDSEFTQPSTSRQHFDVWNFHSANNHADTPGAEREGSATSRPRASGRLSGSIAGPICRAALQGRQKSCSGECRAALSRQRQAETREARDRR
jgi:hypothetical protein